MGGLSGELTGTKDGSHLRAHRTPFFLQSLTLAAVLVPMQVAFEVFRALSALAFVGYGSACLTTRHMTVEFERFGLARFRRLVGALELMGGMGLLVGYVYRPLLLLSSAGLTLLMLLGVLTRVRIRDSVVETLPAFVLFLMNGYVFWYAMGT